MDASVSGGQSNAEQTKASGSNLEDSESETIMKWSNSTAGSGVKLSSVTALLSGLHNLNGGTRSLLRSIIFVV